MSKIKLINTGKKDILAVIVPEEASEPYVFRDRLIYDLLDKKDGSSIAEFKKLPEGNWQILGISTELNEEQWRGVMPLIYEEDILAGYERFMTDQEFQRSNEVNACSTAKESGLSLLESNQCFSVNPYGSDPCKHTTACYDSCQGSCWERADIDYDEWQQAQENTGIYLILKQI